MASRLHVLYASKVDRIAAIAVKMLRRSAPTATGLFKYTDAKCFRNACRLSRAHIHTT